MLPEEPPVRHKTPKRSKRPTSVAFVAPPPAALQGSGSGSRSLFGLGSATLDLDAGLAVANGVSALAMDLGTDAAASAAARYAPAPQATPKFQQPPVVSKAIRPPVAPGMGSKALQLPAIAASSNASAVAWRLDLCRGEGRRSRSHF